MRLLLDENIQIQTVEFLRASGYDVVGVHDEHLVSQSDDIIFQRAQQTQRVLMTYNADFADLRALAGVHHCGIIRLRLSNQRVSVVNPTLVKTLAQLDGLDLKDRLITVADQRIRMRHTFSG
jgi:predicted nuclease of predicted toxin-antitoxin system